MAKSIKQIEHLKRLSELKIGKLSQLKGRKRPAFSRQWRENMSKAQKGHIGHTPWNKGLKGFVGRKKGTPLTEEQRKNYSEIKVRHYDKVGRKGNNRDRKYDLKWKLWREGVFKRDNWTCQLCDKRGSNLEAHHKKGWAMFPILRYVLSNGITLCYPCHKKVDKYRR